MDFKCDELILGKTDADSRALTLLLSISGHFNRYQSSLLLAVNLADF